MPEGCDGDGGALRKLEDPVAKRGQTTLPNLQEPGQRSRHTSPDFSAEEEKAEEENSRGERKPDRLVFQKSLSIPEQDTAPSRRYITDIGMI